MFGILQISELQAKLETRTLAQSALELSVKNLTAELEEARESLDLEAGGREA